MSTQLLEHPDIPANTTIVEAHSEFGQQMGYVHLVSKESDQAQTSYVGLILANKHSGAPGRGHGAVTMAMLDEAMGRAASMAVGRLCYTASMTTNFCAATKVGKFLLAKAKVTRTGKNLVFVDATLKDGDHLIATATGTWANSGHPIPFV